MLRDLAGAKILILNVNSASNSEKLPAGMAWRGEKLLRDPTKWPPPVCSPSQKDLSHIDLAAQ